jgi:hypothetical protein
MWDWAIWAAGAALDEVDGTVGRAAAYLPHK